MALSTARAPWTPLLLAIALLGGCDGPRAPRPQTGLPERAVRLGALEFTLEVAATEEARSTGLMHRRSMPLDRGMLFVFPDERPLSFWMENTYIALDIIYLDAAGRVVAIRSMRPLDRMGVPSGAPARYAIEINEGMGARTGLRPGDRVDLPDDLPDGR